MWQQQQLSAMEKVKPTHSFLFHLQPLAPPDTGVTTSHVSSTSALSIDFIL